MNAGNVRKETTSTVSTASRAVNNCLENPDEQGQVQPWRSGYYHQETAPRRSAAFRAPRGSAPERGLGTRLGAVEQPALTKNTCFLEGRAAFTVEDDHFSRHQYRRRCLPDQLGPPLA